MDPVTETVNEIRLGVAGAWRFKQLVYVGEQQLELKEQLQSVFLFNLCVVKVLCTGRVEVQASKYWRSLLPVDFPDSKSLADGVYAVLRDFDGKYPNLTDSDRQDDFKAVRDLWRRFEKQSNPVRVSVGVLFFIPLFGLYRILPSYIEGWMSMPLVFVIIVAMGLLRRRIGF